MLMLLGSVCLGSSSSNGQQASGKLFFYAGSAVVMELMKDVREAWQAGGMGGRLAMASMVEYIALINLVFCIITYFRQRIFGSVLLYFLIRFVKARLGNDLACPRHRYFALKAFQSLAMLAFVVSELGWDASHGWLLFGLVDLAVLYDQECMFVYSYSYLQALAKLLAKGETPVRRRLPFRLMRVLLRQILLGVVIMLILQNLLRLGQESWPCILSSLQTLLVGFFTYDLCKHCHE